MLGRFGDPMQRMLGIAVGIGDGAQDFGAGVLAIPGGAQLGLQPGVLQSEIVRHVRGKRRHSPKSICAGAGRRRGQPKTSDPAGSQAGRSIHPDNIRLSHLGRIRASAVSGRG